MLIRGTALVINDGRFLLVRDIGDNKFSLPGGGANPQEPPIAAAVRELYEELGMEAQTAERLTSCDYRGSVNHHHVVLIHSLDTPSCNPREIAEFHWWDGTSQLPRQSHVDAILGHWYRHRPTYK
ncbi:NUDIX domain-containing protein [Halothiobacillus diazotrophicus]|uniref:NUDIX domain-containing protein n=1 Tax=Halothiobacillus diazotrophicus TaxID=1860122 RepID=UPI0009ED50E9|nr:NUDIX hydrolase [Halothiobacillus diazotrophicus]